MKLKPWTILFVAAFTCALLCVALVYVITLTGNVSYEYFIYVLVFLGFALTGVGYVIEARYKKEHPEEYHAVE